MRVLQVHCRYRQRGGEDSVVEAEAALLTAAGHHVHRFETSNPDRPAETLTAVAQAPWNRAAAADVEEAAHSFGADVVHVHNTWFALSPAVFSRLGRAGFPVVVTMHNYRTGCVNAQFYRDGGPCEDCLGRFPWPGVVHGCYRDSRSLSAVAAVTIGTARRAGVWEDVTAVIALTRFAAGKLAATGIPPQRIVVKPNTVPDPGVRSQPPSSSSQVLFVGRLSEEKGIADLVDVWAERDLRLAVVGTGPLEDRLRSTSAQNVEFVGFADPAEVRRRMLTARALVVPSRWYEGLPMVLLEGLAAGLPLVVPEHGALTEAAGEAGLAFRPLDPNSLARCLGRLPEDGLVDDLGRRARRRYLEHFSDTVGLRSLLEVYDRAATVDADRHAV